MRTQLQLAFTFALTASLASACLLEEPLDDQIGKSAHLLAHPGRWQIPADVLAVGDTQNVEYTGAGAWLGTQSCSATGLRPGTVELKEYIAEYFPQVSHQGGFNCRHINGNSNVTSVHATGRALDIHIPLTADGSADNDLGDPLAHWLIENSERIGIQIVIWDRTSWGPHRDVGAKERAYTGAHPHHDHLHVELSVDAGEQGTSWFGEEREPPDLGECLPIPADGATIDETDGCVQIMGPSQYWRYEQGVGFEGSLYWTNAFESDNHSNWARWALELESAGAYEVEVYIEPAFALHTETRYEIEHRGEKSKVVIDQSAADGWHSLGVFDFAAGGGQHLALYDNSDSAVAEGQHIAADAIRVTPSFEEPEPEPQPEPEPGLEEVDEMAAGCSSGGGGSGLGGLLLLVGIALLGRRRSVER